MTEIGERETDSRRLQDTRLTARDSNTDRLMRHMEMDGEQERERKIDREENSEGTEDWKQD